MIVTNVDEKASVPERIFPQDNFPRRHHQGCVCDDHVRVEKQENTTQQEHLFVAFRTVTRVKGEKIHGSTHVAFFLYVCISNFVFFLSFFPLRIRPGIVGSQKEFLTRDTCNSIHSRDIRNNYHSRTNI